jgi:DNA modification methylase
MFPVELPSRLIKMLTYKGDNILDPFSGIATTGIACLNTGRNYYGIEIDKKYHSIAIERIKNEINLLKK